MDGAAVDLDRSSQAIFACLVAGRGEEVCKDELLEAGWPDRIVHENSLAKCISRLRSCLGDEGKAIIAVYGSGYRLEGEFGDPHPSGSEPALPNWVERLSRRPVLAAVGLACLIGTAAVLGSALGYALGETAGSHDNERSEALVAFMADDLLSSSDPYASSVADASVRETVERAAATIDRRFADDPATLVLLHRAIAGTFSGWGEYERAVAHLGKARSIATGLEDSAPLQQALVDIELCQQLRLAGDTRQGERACDRSVHLTRNWDSADRTRALVAKAKLDFEIGNYAAAQNALKEAVASEDIEPATLADAEWFYGLTLRKLAHFDEAEAAFTRHLDLRKKLHGAAHPLTGWAHADYGDFLGAIGRYNEAEGQLDRAEKIFTERLGANHPESLSPRYSRAVNLLEQSRAAEALAILEPMLARYRDTLGSDHFWTLYVMHELALARAMTGDEDAAVALLREARQIGSRTLYGRSAKAAHFHLRAARTFSELGRVEEARDEARRAGLSMDAGGFAATHPWRGRLECIGSRIEVALGNPSRAAAMARQCIDSLEAAAVPETYPALVEARKLARLQRR